jgi:hypothetical protein
VTEEVREAAPLSNTRRRTRGCISSFTSPIPIQNRRDLLKDGVVLQLALTPSVQAERYKENIVATEEQVRRKTLTSLGQETLNHDMAAHFVACGGAAVVPCRSWSLCASAPESACFRAWEPPYMPNFYARNAQASTICLSM